MAENMGDVFANVFFIDMLEVLNGPKEFHDSLFFDGLHSDELSQVLSFKWWSVLWLLDVFVEDFFKERNELFFHLIDGKAWAQDSVDSVSAVLGFIELDQIVSDLWMGKGLVVTDWESAVRSLG